MSFFFRHFLASFPRFLYFLGILRVSPQPGNIEPCRISPSRAPAGTCAGRRSSNIAFNARIGHSIGVRFGFVFSFVLHMPLFVFNEMVASFVLFLIHFRFLVPLSTGTVPAIPCALLVAGPRLRQCVHNMTTVIGYHRQVVLSSEKCKTPPALSPSSRSLGASLRTAFGLSFRAEPWTGRSRAERGISVGSWHTESTLSHLVATEDLRLLGRVCRPSRGFSGASSLPFSPRLGSCEKPAWPAVAALYERRRP